jgi:regulator of protease activity HflC (stomatin/prohibitin superfamily)
MAEPIEPAEYAELRDIPTSKWGLNAVSAVVLLIGGALTFGAAVAAKHMAGVDMKIFLAILGGGGMLSAYFALAPRVALQWERAIVLRLGRYRALKGPGLFWILPFIDTIPMWIDLRIRPTPFNAEKTLTRDTVPVDVDAVLFWVVKDPEKAALEVIDYQAAMTWAAQTALRDIIGKTDLSSMLQGREVIDLDLQKLIEAHTRSWGITVHSVEIRDVTIPPALEDAMSRQAQAEREKQARVILSQAEVEIAERFETASRRYSENPTAFQLRAMNILYEGIKEQGSLMVVPTALADSLSAGSLAGLAGISGREPRHGNGGGGPKT